MFKRLKHRLFSSFNFLLILVLLSYSTMGLCRSNMGTELGPWFTGPILAPSGQTSPKGQFSITAYGFYSQNKGYFNRQRHLRVIGFSPETIIGLPVISYGLTDWMDIQAVSSYVYQKLPRFHSNGPGDTTLTAGFQIFRQGESISRPSLRLVFLETIPTGHFNRLNEVFNGANAVGLGGYRTGIVLAFQHLLPLPNAEYIRNRFALGYVYSEKVDVHGVSGFGGTPTTEGTISPGDIFSADWSVEATLNQNWVAVFEAYYINRGADSFEGFLGRSRLRRNPTIGRPAQGSVQLLPAVEYNFTSNIGLLGGVWFPIAGRAAPNFVTYTLALNAAWAL